MKQRISMAAAVVGCFLIIICTAGTFPNESVISPVTPVTAEEPLDVEEGFLPVEEEVSGEAAETEADELKYPEEPALLVNEAVTYKEEEKQEEIEGILWEAPANGNVGYVIADVSGSVNIRAAAGAESDVVGKIYDDGLARVLGVAGEGAGWFHIVSGNVEGYVKGEFFRYEEASEEEYAALSEEHPQALTVEEDAALRAQEQPDKIPVMQNIVFPDTSYTTNEELRRSIVEYAMQYVGNRYVSGGKSLAGGTDCSGFTCFVYADFGYAISRTPQGQFDGTGYAIDYSEIQAGDIICYSDNGGHSCTHVALYIGDGKIVHSANSRKGVIVGNADYSPIIGIKRVID